MNLWSSLSIVEYSSSVYLGTTIKEKDQIQQVLIDIDIEFNHIIQAEKSDDLNQTLDYVGICTLIDKVCASKKFNLIENLAHEICQAVVRQYRLRYKGCVAVSVFKTQVPVPGLKGVKWTCKDTLS